MAAEKAGSTVTDLATVGDAGWLEQVQASVLDGVELPGNADPEMISRAIAERILNATSFEEAFVPAKVDPWRQHLEVPVVVQGVHFNRSGIEGQSIYAVVDLEVLADESRLTVTCGGKNVMAQLISMLKNGWMNRPVKLTDKTTGEGYKVLWLEAAGPGPGNAA